MRAWGYSKNIKIVSKILEKIKTKEPRDHAQIDKFIKYGYKEQAKKGSIL